MIFWAELNSPLKAAEEAVLAEVAWADALPLAEVVPFSEEPPSAFSLTRVFRPFCVSVALRSDFLICSEEVEIKASV